MTSMCIVTKKGVLTSRSMAINESAGVVLHDGKLQSANQISE